MRLAGIEKGGYYPYPPHMAEATASWFIPLPAGTRGRLLDPCAGEIPRFTDADMLHQRVRAVLCQHRHTVLAGVDGIGEWEVDAAIFAGKGHRGLGPLLAQDAQLAALAASQD